MKVNRALVTGGAGFIGSHIVDELIAKGIETYVIDDLSTGSVANLSAHERDPLMKRFVGDIRKLRTVISGVDIDVVFHEAAIASVPRSITEPELVFDVNMNGSMEVLKYCLGAGVKRLVFASSAAVYGNMTEPAVETMACAPTSPYGATKIAFENYLKAYYNSYGLETVALRYFNVYGPRQRMSDDYSGVITLFTKQLISGQTPTIFGDGLQTRDFVNVKDIVQANMLAMDRFEASGEVFNVATGRQVTILELLTTLAKLTGRPDTRPAFKPQREGDLRSGAASITKISSLLGYSPDVTLEGGLVSVVGHIRSALQAVEVQNE